MCICSKCGTVILSSEWNYCPDCGAKLPENCLIVKNEKFVYGQLFELMKLENDRRQRLDSKAHTYIGLLSIAVTIVISLGGLLTIETIKLYESLDKYLIILFYCLHISIVILLTANVLFAFRAYHTGASKLNKSYLFNLFCNIFLKNVTKKEIFSINTANFFSKLNDDLPLNNMRKMLVIHINQIILNNSFINDEKSDNILNAYIATIIAIFLLVILTILIGIIGLDKLGVFEVV